jgi:hypothetical protein
MVLRGSSVILLCLQIHLSGALDAIEILDPVLKFGRSFWLGVYVIVLLDMQGPLLLMVCILAVCTPLLGFRQKLLHHHVLAV